MNSHVQKHKVEALICLNIISCDGSSSELLLYIELHYLIQLILNSYHHQM